LSPGIREVVRLPHAAGFATCDSGDGVTREHACDPGRPYVHVRLEPPLYRLAGEAGRLYQLMAAQGIACGPLDEEGTAPNIEAHYNPADSFATISLRNVDDAMLAGGREAST
jgi:hypothetical protein